ncbi:MAG: low-specificity L-threonine aldolase [Anaerolineae bacterium]|nr:low-specificity L-threonine aldolase [Anaerolineae bacterium]
MANKHLIDLRSDTVTLPTPAMRQAMYEAELGDDVYGEDPTVNRLEALAAERLGKEAAMFVPSGTMANLTALLAHCARGDEAIMGHVAHTFLFEAGSSSAVGGIHPHTVPNQPDGTLALEEIEAAIRPDNEHHPPTRLICLENTHNRCGGAVLTPAYMHSVRELADRHGLAIHLDGARIFNAAVALGLPAAALARDADSVSFCLSKGLAAPVGSLVCGTAGLVRRARRQRKMLGGGMRQAGVLAAAGIVALEQMVDRLADDHAHARRLAEGLAALPGVLLDPARVQTNLVIFELAPGAPEPHEFVAALAARGVKLGAIGGRRFRAVTHYGLETSDIDRAVAAARDVLGAS